MENSTFLKELKFGMGDGNLNYYLYNFKCPYIPENKVSVIVITVHANIFFSLFIAKVKA